MIHWNGTSDEARDLMAAAQAYCICKYDAADKRVYTCDMHHAILKDQAFVDALLRMHRLRAQLIKEEESDTDARATD